MNHLAHIDEFRTLLAGYQPSEAAKATLAKTRLALLAGPTSSGRNTIITELLKTGAYHCIVSDTTRQPRSNNGVPVEQNGREYWFRKEEDVLADLRQGGYIEAAIIHNQQVSGANIREIDQAQRSGQVAISDIEPNGIATYHRLKPDTVILFVVPPDFASWMQRLSGRSAMPEEEVRRRLNTACGEIRMALTNDYYTFVLNDRLETAVATVDAIIRQGMVDAPAQAHIRHVAEDLGSAAQAYLAQLLNA